MIMTCKWHDLCFSCKCDEVKSCQTSVPVLPPNTCPNRHTRWSGAGEQNNSIVTQRVELVFLFWIKKQTFVGFACSFPLVASCLQLTFLLKATTSFDLVLNNRNRCQRYSKLRRCVQSLYPRGVLVTQSGLKTVGDLPHRTNFKRKFDCLHTLLKNCDR